MDALQQRNRDFLKDTFAGQFRGHGFIFGPPRPRSPLGDFMASERPVREWLPWAVSNYETAVKYHRTLHDDSVPYVNLATNTGIFAAAFGCKLHVYQEETNACALPCVFSAAEAGGLRQPRFDAPPLDRFFELARLVRRELGPAVPIGVPDVQSPFDIAALIWNKETMFLALYEDPQAVKDLVGKCTELLKSFLIEYRRQLGEVNYCHYPYCWAPNELGCWLSEDEVGSLSPAMFEEFCLPALAELSQTFGGVFMHCCAKADHQYGGFRKIPNLRGLNRAFHAPGPKPAIEMFSGRSAFITTDDEAGFGGKLGLALPQTRFVNCTPSASLDDACRLQDRLRARCPRVELASVA